MPKHATEASAASIRNTLALMCSQDLQTWKICCVLIYHPDLRCHGFQYPAWVKWNGAWHDFCREMKRLGKLTCVGTVTRSRHRLPSELVSLPSLAHFW